LSGFAAGELSGFRTAPRELINEPDDVVAGPAPDRAALVEALCIQQERVVERDNTVTWRKLKFQLPDSPLRYHWVKARVRIHQYPDDTLALFHGPACIARYDALGRPPASKPIAAGRARSCSAPPRAGRAKVTTPAATSRRPPGPAHAHALARLT
jgi:hypothetical protein